jgi:hypothetical protein
MMLDQKTQVEFKGVVYETYHGAPFDRGSADSYYHRGRLPHKGGVGGSSGPRITELTLQERDAYLAGYEQNEEEGFKKDWG